MASAAAGMARVRSVLEEDDNFVAVRCEAHGLECPFDGLF